MIGCFNITLFSYFDIHRIFDLILCRLWDFVMWWFDLDFLLFDFNFDFILCISFIFLFLLHFFLKLIFSFLVNFINFRNNAQNPITSVLYNYYFVSFITFLFIFGLFYVLMLLEFYNTLNSLCFFDFDSISSMHVFNEKSYNTSNLSISYLFLLFYYTIFFFTNLYIIILRYFFSYSYVTQIHVDYNVSNKTLDSNMINMCALYIISAVNLYFTQYTILTYTIFLYLNVTITYNMIVIFYMFTIFSSNKVSVFQILLLKSVKYLHNLSILYSICFSKNVFSDLTFIHILVYILFIINVLGSMIKDFNFINFILNFYNTTSFFELNFNDFNNVQYFWMKKQLTYIVFL